MRWMIGLLFAVACYGQAVDNDATKGTRNDSALNWIPPTATFAAPPAAPPTGGVYVFTDASATGTCSGGGSSLATCRWNGAAWSATGGGTTLGVTTGGANTVVLFGDSITWFNAPNADGRLTFNGSGYFTWANAFLKQGFQVANYAGVSGNTTAQMLARINSDVIAYSPGWCIVLGGTNDIYNGVSSASIIANLKAIYSALNAAGIRMVLLTMLPDARYATDTTKRGIWATVNLWMKEWAKGVPNVVLVDTAAAIIDPTNATLVMKPATNSDGTHPDMAGSYLTGGAIANALASVVLPPATLPEWNSDPLNLVLNAMNAGTTGTLAGGATGQVASSWTLTNSGTTCVGSKGTRSDGLPGVTQIITMTGSSATSSCGYDQTITGWSDGDTLFAQAEIMAGSAIGHHFLLAMVFHSAVGDFLYTWGGEMNQGTSDPVSQTLPQTIVVRTPVKQIWSAITGISAGIYVYGTSGAVSVGRVEVRKAVTP